jgi:hypothetical protein
MLTVPPSFLFFSGHSCSQWCEGADSCQGQILDFQSSVRAENIQRSIRLGGRFAALYTDDIFLAYLGTLETEPARAFYL